MNHNIGTPCIGYSFVVQPTTRALLRCQKKTYCDIETPEQFC